MLTLLRSSSLVLVIIISRIFVLTCNCFHARRGNISKKHFLEGYPSFTLACAGLLEAKRSALELLKSAFNAKNFVCMPSWSVFKYFVAIHS